MIRVLVNNTYLQRFYFRKSEIDKALINSCLFSLLMVVTRIVYTKEWMFAWLIWNLFLAYLPYFVSNFITKASWTGDKIKVGIALLVWLVFIPNSFYIITDLFHLKQTEVIPFWFDLALLFLFAWNGLLLGILSVRHIEKIVEQWVAYKSELWFVYPVMLLNAFGIFIGRYWRFNSWDVATNPFQLTHDIIDLLLHPIQYRFDWSMIGCFSVLLTLFYISLKRLSRSIG